MLMKTQVVISRRLLLIISLFILFNNIHAQEKQSKFWKGWGLTAGWGPSLFYGDTENYRIYKVFENNNEWRFGYTAMLEKKLSSVFTLRGQLMYGELSGTKRKDNIWFEGDLVETSINLKADLINLFGNIKDRKLTVYAMAGIGFTHWQTELMDKSTNEVIASNGIEEGGGFSERTTETVIPMGLGIDYNISPKFTFALEGTMRPVNSDLLDANVGGFGYDFYGYFFASVTYHFVRTEKAIPEMPPEVIAYEEPEVVPAPVEEPVVEEPPKEPEPVQEPELTIDEKLIKAEENTGIYESPWPDVEFRVQIAASKIALDPQKVQKDKNLPGDLKVNEGGGWYRYSAGGFIKYWKAKEYRNILVTRYGVKDAFVVAYRGDERINLHELIGEAEQSDPDDLIDEYKRPAFAKAFSVQVLASNDGSFTAETIQAMFDIEENVYKEFSEGLYLYTVGNFDTYSDAAKIRNKLKGMGIKGAFVVGFKDGIRVNDIREILD